MESFGVVVIGAGHAGCEAALSSARMGVSTALLTLDPEKAATMPCNPSIGGVGKGQLVKEIDALGGEMGKNADFTGIHFKQLNTRKGSAVRSSRSQNDKFRYAERMQKVISREKHIRIIEGEVKKLIVKDGKIEGVFLDGKTLGASNVVVTSGTFMRAVMHCGEETSTGGRFGEKASLGLSDQLRAEGFRISRLKTGTPPRLKRGSIDFSKLAVQESDPVPRKFSFFESSIPLPQVNCFLGYSSPATHEVIRQNLHLSPLYSGRIQGVGPRYCPSIEDKVVKFPQKDRHQIFFEPESLDTDWIYPNGISTSLPATVQELFVRTLPGCEKVEFTRFGYAVEYDCIDPRQLGATLESREVAGLFFAGQVNGTSGYEEAAAQGLLAGINAALREKNEEPLILGREHAYLGVLVDDLTTLGVTEPYRMFTSRAEFRLSLREDNADLRLSHLGRRVGLLSEGDFERVERKREAITRASEFLKSHHTSQGSLWQYLKRPEKGLLDIEAIEPIPVLTVEARETLETECKYEGYINLQRQEIEKLRRMRLKKIPKSVDFSKIAGLSFELREKLGKFQPDDFEEAGKIPGVTPAALTALLFHLESRH